MFRLVPVFAKSDFATYNISPSSIEEKITPKTKAIIVEHIFGQSCDMDPILDLVQNNDLLVIEDCAQACGSEYKGKKVGSIGNIGYFSFSKGKNLTTFEGGMVVTNNEHFANIIRMERNKCNSYSIIEIIKLLLVGMVNYLLTQRYTYIGVVFPWFYLHGLIKSNFLDFDERPRSFTSTQFIRNIRLMSNIQAAIGIEQLRRLEGLNKRRIENSLFLKKGLQNLRVLNLVKEIEGIKNTYSCFPIRIMNAIDLRHKLLRRGIDVRRDWMSIYSDNKELNRTILYLPNHPGLNRKDMIYLTRVLEQIIRN